MKQPEKTANDKARGISKSDQRQLQPDGLGNQNITRPARIDQQTEKPSQADQRGLENLDVTRPAPSERR